MSAWTVPRTQARTWAASASSGSRPSSSANARSRWSMTVLRSTVGWRRCRGTAAGTAGQQNNRTMSRLGVLEPTEPAELHAVGIELVKANEADFIGVGSLQVTAEAGTGKTAQDGVAGVEALRSEERRVG